MVVHQALLSMEFSRQEDWSGSPFPTPGDLPTPSHLCLLHWQADSLPLATSEASKSTTPQSKKGEKRTLSNALPMLHDSLSNKPTCRLSDALQRGSLSVAPGSASEPVRNAEYWALPGTD